MSSIFFSEAQQLDNRDIESSLPFKGKNYKANKCIYWYVFVRKENIAPQLSTWNSVRLSWYFSLFIAKGNDVSL